VIKLRLSRRPRKMNWSAAPLTSNYEPDTVCNVKKTRRKYESVTEMGQVAYFH